MASVTQIKRLLGLLEHLQSENAYNARQLAEQAGVSRRTLFRDLRALEKLGFEIRYDERAQRYVVEGEAASLIGDEEKTDELKTLMTLGQRLEGGPDEVRARIAEIPKLLDLRADAPTSEAEGKTFAKVLTGLCERKKLRVMQNAAGGSTQVVSLTPYRMVFSHGCWHLVGADDTGEVRLHTLADLMHVEVTEDSFTMPDDESVEEAVNQALGRSADIAQEDVVVRFSSDVARDVAQRKWFRSQELEWLDNGQLELRTRGDASQLVQWVLSFGGEASVVKPDMLRKDVATHVSKMAQQYGTTV